MSGLKLAHAVAGRPDRQAVVLLHSIGTDRTLWADYSSPLVAADHRVIAVDLRGHGRSPVPTGPYRIAELASDVVMTLDALGCERADVVGVSIGGAVALQLAVDFPERIGRLVVCCSAPWFGGPEVWAERSAIARRDGLGPLLNGTVDRWFTELFRQRHPERVSRLAETFIASPAAGYAACGDALATVDLSDALASVAAPTLVIGGADDVATPVASGCAPIAAAIVGAQLEVVPAAHLAPYERPDLVLPMVLDHLADSGMTDDR